MTFNISRSVIEAKKWLRQRVNSGADCPCCNQHVKVYPRSITSFMAKCLISLYKKSGFINQWISSKAVTDGSGDFAKLRYWGLIQEKPKEEGEDKKNSGYWRITNKGIDFVEKRIEVPKIAMIYNGTCLKFSGPDVSIEYCLRNKYSYRKLMAA